MTESVFEVPEIGQERDVDLVAQRTLGGGPQVPRVGKRVSIGGPIVVAITADRVASGKLADFVKSEAKVSRYSLMRLSVSFHPDPLAPITKAVVAILLQSDGAANPPIAWSLDPRRLYRPPKQITRTIGLTAQLGLLAPSGQMQEVQPGTDPLLVALGELESAPEWQFTGSNLNPLEGIYALTLVSKIPIGIEAHANLAISARLQRKALGVFPYTAELSEDKRIVSL